VRIPGDDIAHLFVARTPGQVRGTSWLAPVATRLEQLDRVEDALAERVNVSALFGGFVTDPSGTSGFGEGRTDPQAMTIEPGTMRVIPGDATVTFPNMPSLEDTPDFLRHLLRQIGAGVGLPYEILANDYSPACSPISPRSIR
jgi:capsid protein